MGNFAHVEGSFVPYTLRHFASIGGVLWADLIGEARIAGRAGILADVERDGSVWTVYIVRE